VIWDFKCKLNIYICSEFAFWPVRKIFSIRITTEKSYFMVSKTKQKNPTNQHPRNLCPQLLRCRSTRSSTMRTVTAGNTVLSPWRRWGRSQMSPWRSTTEPSPGTWRHVHHRSPTSTYRYRKVRTRNCYCEIILFRGVFNYVEFVGKTIHEFKYPQNKILSVRFSNLLVIIL